MKTMMKLSKSIPFLLLVAGFCLMQCKSSSSHHSTSAEGIIQEQRDVSLYRQKPYILSTKGKALISQNELIFVPTKYFWLFYIHGKDSTVIKLDEIQELQRKQWFLIFPFRVDLVTTDGNKYPFVSVSRDKLINALEKSKRDAE